MWEPFQEVAEMQMPVEEYDEDGKHVVRVELPGIDPEKDVSVTVQDGLLRIRAERRHEEKTEEPHYFRQEIRYGSFARDLPLPPDCGEEDVTADYTDGILTVRLPLDHEKATAKKVPITRG
jgi:HSP20 family protein